jgi:DNA-binding HxlR family transcriptional regulator
MDAEKLSSTRCAVSRALALVGDAWSVLILRDASLGMTQFDQFRSSLGIAPSILSRRLKAMTHAGVLEKRQYSARPPRDEYVLTDCGRDFIPILNSLGEWGIRYNGHGLSCGTGDDGRGATEDVLGR